MKITLYKLPEKDLEPRRKFCFEKKYIVLSETVKIKCKISRHFCRGLTLKVHALLNTKHPIHIIIGPSRMNHVCTLQSCVFSRES